MGGLDFFRTILHVCRIDYFAPALACANNTRTNPVLGQRTDNLNLKESANQRRIGSFFGSVSLIHEFQQAESFGHMEAVAHGGLPRNLVPSRSRSLAAK